MNAPQLALPAASRSPLHSPSRNPYTAFQISGFVEAVYGLRDEMTPKTSRNPYTADKNSQNREAVYGLRDAVAQGRGSMTLAEAPVRHRYRRLSRNSPKIGQNGRFWANSSTVNVVVDEWVSGSIAT